MSLLLLKLPMIFCPRRLAPKLIFAGARCFRNSALSAGPGTKTTFKTRLGPQDSNSPPVISQHTEKTPPIVRPGTYVKSVEYNREEEEGKVELHNPYQGIPTAWQVAYEHPFPPLRPTCPPPHCRTAAYFQNRTAWRTHRPIPCSMCPVTNRSTSRSLDLDSQSPRQTSTRPKLRSSGRPTEGASSEGARRLGKNHSR